MAEISRFNIRSNVRFLRSFAVRGCLITFAIFMFPTAWAQTPRIGTPPDASGQRPGLTQPEPEDEAQQQMAKKQEQRRNEERQKLLVKDTNDLLALATELKQDVDKTDKNVLSVDVVRKAEEIEKLARNVKDRMRSR